MQNVIEFEKSRRSINWKNLSIVITFHLLTIPAFFLFSWQNFAVMLIGNWIVGSLGIGLGYHRLLTHRSFKAPKWLEYTLTIFGAMAIQDDAPKWVATHRIHHQFVETEKDPHSTRPGFWWAHMEWILRGTAQDHDEATLKRYVPDLLKDKFHVLLAKYYYIPLVLSGFLLFAIGGWSMVLWGVFVRIVFGWHSTWFVNSATHFFGKRRFATEDDSTNNAWVAILTFGEGWHNNHHAQPTSARHGLKWYEFDMNWLTIRLFEKLGWAKQIRIFDAEKPPLELKKAA
ncbi:MAG: fatty acid desaturase [Acidobacteria bacterium]|jgi:stearoyl-CoA desaturase (delta-9 desaturase)|nr:fatty acid desaturase [Acidobacteriota bacterium]MBA3783976.1 fatty acid desaturase [Acidobacteriota bacterium]MBA4182670.1 fatty acid desaturase [Acidobacteriota bacterium]